MPLNPEHFDSGTNPEIIQIAIKIVNLVEGAGLVFDVNGTTSEQFHQFGNSFIGLYFGDIFIHIYPINEEIHLWFTDFSNDNKYPKKEDIFVLTENTDYSEFVNRIIKN